MEIFEKVFTRLLNEDMISGDGGSFGSFPDQKAGAQSTDFYAPGDERMPFVLGAKSAGKKKKGKKTIAFTRRNIKFQ